MPTVNYREKTMQCAKGELLGDVLQRHGLSPHNGLSKWVNCHGLGTCGTCAVEVVGDVSPKTLIEWLRLGLPPHRGKKRLRLACKVRVLGNVDVVKHPGFWGERVDAG